MEKAREVRGSEPSILEHSGCVSSFLKICI